MYRYFVQRNDATIVYRAEQASVRILECERGGSVRESGYLLDASYGAAIYRYVHKRESKVKARGCPWSVREAYYLLSVCNRSKIIWFVCAKETAWRGAVCLEGGEERKGEGALFYARTRLPAGPLLLCRLSAGV